MIGVRQIREEDRLELELRNRDYGETGHLVTGEETHTEGGIVQIIGIAIGTVGGGYALPTISFTRERATRAGGKPGRGRVNPAVKIHRERVLI